MTSVRLPTEIEKELEVYSMASHKSKSDIIKEALIKYLDAVREEKDSYELGKEFFGKRGSGNITPRDYKAEVKEKIRAKHRTR